MTKRDKIIGGMMAGVFVAWAGFLALYASINGLPSAGERSTAASGPRRLVPPTGDQVHVWRDEDAMTEGWALLEAAESDARTIALIERMACIVPAGTEVDTRFISLSVRSVLVVNGPDTGCKGVVPMELVK